MNCQTARQSMDLLLLQDGAVKVRSEVQDHLEHCSNCQQLVERQREFDRRAGELCRQVPVPDDLKTRLLSSLPPSRELPPISRPDRSPPASVTESAAREPSLLEFPSPPQPSAPLSRARHWTRRALITAMLACLATGAWALFAPTRPTLRLDEIVRQALALELAPAGTSDLLQFRNGHAPRLPATMRPLPLQNQPQQLRDWDVAVYFFSMRDGAGRLQQGRLVVLPRTAVSDPPHETGFLAGPVRYNTAYCTTTWCEGPLVYVCCVTGGEDMLYRWQHRSV